ncbi:MAG TPA: lipid-binding SYLF domain-containing protein [Kofleriaceae bacterium]|jgi:lipid-binding SYLF domain-containing protein|nr:lipid-binding SYLF domain-containing protein [Kofleriaceae bacterium]
MKKLLMSIALATATVGACAHRPETASEQRNLEQRANATLATMQQRDPGLRNLLGTSAGYVVFPEIGKGGLVVGGASGMGVLYERGMPVGSVRLTQASIGALAGGQTFAELITIRDPYQVQRLKMGQFKLGADISAVALTSGAAASAATGDVSVFVMPRGGLMVDVSVAGQQLKFEPSAG